MAASGCEGRASGGTYDRAAGEGHGGGMSMCLYGDLIVLITVLVRDYS